MTFLAEHSAVQAINACRIAMRESGEHKVSLDERHLKRLLSEYGRYHHEDRTHLGLAKQTPAGRTPSAACGPFVSHPRLGGLHHR